MIKVKDGYAKLVGTTASGSASHILLSNGGVKAVSDFALKSDIPDVSKYLPLSGGKLLGELQVDARVELMNGQALEWTDTQANGSTSCLLLPRKDNSYRPQYYDGTNWHYLAYSSDLKNPTNYYWANIAISSSKSTTTTPTFGSVTVPLSGLIVGSKSTDTSPTRVLMCYDTTLVTKYINIGNDPSAGNAGEFHYTYSASASASNNVGMGFYSGNRLKLYYNGGSGVGKVVIASAASGGTEYELLHLGNYKNYIDDMYWANIPLQSTSDSTKIPIFGGMTVNGHTLINKRLTIGLDLGNWDSSRAELELISPSGQANDFWLGSGLRDWSITSRPAAENNTLNFHAHISSTTTPLVMVLEKSGNTTIYGNLQIGKSDTRNYIAFRGTTGDNPGSFNHTYIGENLWGGSESSELILYKGNDIGATATTVDVSGADRIRHIAGGHLFQIYKSALSGTFENICTSTVPVNMLAIHLNSIQTYAPLVIVGSQYSGNYGINMQNSDIVGINALYTADSAEDGGEGLQFSRGNGYYDSIWASSGTLYFSPNGNLNRAGSYSTNYTVIHSGNIGSQSVNYATSAGNADTVDSCHKDDFLRRTATLGSINKFVLEDIPKGVTQVGSIGWTDYQNHPHAGGLWMTLRGTSSLRTALILFPSYSMSSPPILYSSIDGGAWQGGYQLAYTSQIPTTMAWGSITGKPSTFTPSSHTHDDRYYTESEADSRFINHSGDTMTGPLTFANGTWNVVGDDAAIGDYNAAGMLGLKSINNNIPGIGFHNSSNTLLGRLQANGSNLLWNDLMLLHSSNWHSYIGGDGYVMRTWSIDATGLDLNTWYPVTMQLPSVHWVRIEVKETLSARSKPLWATHDSGFHVIKIWHSIGYGWGTTSAISQRLILQSDYNWCSIDPVRGIGLLSSSSTEYVYVRGGGRYYVSTSHNVVPTLRTSTYTVYDQSVGPTTDTPAAITAMYSDKSIYAPHFYENSDAKLKENINLISSSDNIPLLKLFDWKSDGKHSYGLIAQELEAMGYSELVEESGDHKTVNYSAALSLIVGKLQVKIKEIEKENKELRDEINNLKTNKLWQS